MRRSDIATQPPNIYPQRCRSELAITACGAHPRKAFAIEIQSGSRRVSYFLGLEDTTKDLVLPLHYFSFGAISFSVIRVFLCTMYSTVHTPWVSARATSAQHVCINGKLVRFSTLITVANRDTCHGPRCTTNVDQRSSSIRQLLLQSCKSEHYDLSADGAAK
jgi:hypothetical protein